MLGRTITFPSAIPAIRLLLLTGCRRNEILTLRWDDIDRTAGEIRLSDSKTGARRVPLTPAVEWVLERIPRIEGNPWVITGQNAGDRLKNLDMIWQRIRRLVGLDNVRIQDCRHSYASMALAAGESIPVISKLLGHRRFSTTARYAHLARDGERAAAAQVGDSIGGNRSGPRGRNTRGRYPNDAVPREAATFRPFSPAWRRAHPPSVERLPSATTSSPGTKARRRRSDWSIARFRSKTISRRTVGALKVDRDTMFWDSELAGFGVRVYASGSKVYIVQTRAGGKAAQRVTIGHHGHMTPEEARRRAALIISRIKAGEEPVPELLATKLANGPTVAGLAQRYLEDHVAVRCRPNTAELYRLIVAKYLVPKLGKVPALAVDHAQVTEQHHSLREKPVMANKVVETLSRIYNAAEDKGLIPEATNPCGLVVKNRERKRERFLTPEEFQRLGRALSEAETCKGVSVHAVAAIRLVILMGCRKHEILNLRPDCVRSSSCPIDRVDCAVGSVQRSPNRSEWTARRYVGGPNPVPASVWSLEHEVRT